MIQALGAAARRLLRRRGFSLAVVITLALGAGTTAAVFSVAYAVLVADLPYPDAEQLLLIEGTVRRDGVVREGFPLSYADITDWRRGLASEANGALRQIAAFSYPRSFNLIASDGRQSVDAEPQRVVGELVSANYFQLLGVDALRGRLLATDDDRPPAGTAVIVLGYSLWRDHFGAEPAVVGAKVWLDGRPYEVVGVAPRGFHGATDEAEMWLPVTAAVGALGPNYVERRGLRWLQALGRLDAAATVDAGQAQLDRLTAELGERYPDTNGRMGARATPLRQAWFGDRRPALLALVAGALGVLLIACVNVANLLLVDALGRRRELALRGALGAGPGQLAAQPVLETLLLSLAAGLFGLLTAAALTGGPLAGNLLRTSGARLRSFVDIGLHLPVALAVLLLVTLCALAVASIPTAVALRTPPAAALRQGFRGTGGMAQQRLRGTLVIGQIGLAVVLLLTTGLSVRDLRQLLDTPLGYQPDSVLTLRLDARGPAYAEAADARRLAGELLDALQALPGVASAALVSPGLPTDDWYEAGFTLDDRVSSSLDDDGTVALLYHFVTPGYFDTLGLPLVEGRALRDADRAGGQPVAVVSQALLDTYWPAASAAAGTSALGRQLKRGARDSDQPWLSVVGVAASARHQGLSSAPRPSPDVYLPLLQVLDRPGQTLNLLLRAESGVEPASLAAPVRMLVHRLAPELAVYDVRPLTERLHAQSGPARFLVLLNALFAVLALVLVGVGLYGVLAVAVAQRRRELGIRLALGARPRQLVLLVLHTALRWATLGCGLGLLTFAAVRPWWRQSLGTGLAEGSGTGSGTLPWLDDLPLALLACGILVAVTLLAALRPARRAAATDPADLTRES